MLATAMELTKDLSAEKVNFPEEQRVIRDIQQEVKNGAPNPELLSEGALFEMVETILLERIKSGDKRSYFQLGLLLFEQGSFEKARNYFERSRDFDFQSVYQLSVMMYDGIGGQQDCFAAVELMKYLAASTSRHAKHLQNAVRFNIGRAYFQGYGVTRQSDLEAERWWLIAADDGNPLASVKAQSTLGMYYSRKGDSLDLDKAFFWHSEACGNGSLESQGALGVMYLYGVGVKKDLNSAYICLKDASDRGNVYAMGNLISLFYQRKLFTKAADLASKVAALKNVSLIATETDCLGGYIQKGISMACFYYARCLALGLGIKKDPATARMFYSKSYAFDPDVCARLQNNTQHGVI